MTGGSARRPRAQCAAGTLCLGVGDGHRGEERLGVGVRRTLVDVLAVADLDDLAQVHDGHPVGDVPDHRQVMRDEEEGDAQLLLQVVEKVDDTRLDRHVERRDRLVQHEQLGLEHERPGDADTLALATGELVRVAVGVVRLEPDQLEHLGHAPLVGRSGRGCRGSGAARRWPRRSGRRGSSEPKGSWKTTWICRRMRRMSPDSSSVSSVPSNLTEPEVG